MKMLDVFSELSRTKDSFLGYCFSVPINSLRKWLRMSCALTGVFTREAVSFTVFCLRSYNVVIVVKRTWNKVNGAEQKTRCLNPENTFVYGCSLLKLIRTL